MNKKLSKLEHKSDCCGAPVKIVGGDEGTNHWECSKCHKSCNDVFYTSPQSKENWEERFEEEFGEQGWLHRETCVGDLCKELGCIKPEVQNFIRRVAQEEYERGISDGKDEMIKSDPVLANKIQQLIDKARSDERRKVVGDLREKIK